MSDIRGETGRQPGIGKDKPEPVPFEGVPHKKPAKRKRLRNCLGCGVRFKSDGIHNRQCAECAARSDWPPTVSLGG